jgi:hypothetical protein
MGKLKPIDMVDGRTPEELKADGDDKWPDGTPYVPPKHPSRLGEPDAMQTPNFEIETLTVTPEGIRTMTEQSAMTAQVTTESRPTYRQLVTEEIAKRLIDFGPREACWILTDALRLAGKGAEGTDQFRADDFRRLADHVWEMQQRVSN